MGDVDTESLEDTLNSIVDGIDLDADDTVEAPLGNEESEEVTSEGDNDTEDKEAKAEKEVDWEKRYSELRSMNDRRFGEQEAARSKLEGQLEALMSQQSSTSEAQLRAQDQAEQEAFTKEWMEKIEENPGMAVKYHQQMAKELIEINNYQMERRIDERLKALNLDNRLQQLTPGYKEKQAKAEALAKELDIPFDAAFKVAEKMSSGKSVKQPEAPTAPGRVGGGKAPSKDEVAPIALSAADQHLMKMLGLDEKDSADIAKGVAAELASIGE